jgi:hypothetical protein
VLDLDILLEALHDVSLHCFNGSPDQPPSNVIRHISGVNIVDFAHNQHYNNTSFAQYRTIPRT